MEKLFGYVFGFDELVGGGVGGYGDGGGGGARGGFGGIGGTMGYLAVERGQWGRDVAEERRLLGSVGIHRNEEDVDTESKER